MAQLSLAEFEKKIKRMEKDLVEKGIPLAKACLDIVPKIGDRIFIEGKNQQGSLTGHGAYNDNKELYVNPSTSPGTKFTPAGKPFEFRDTKSSVRNELGFRILGKSKPGKLKRVRSTTRFVKGEARPHLTRWFPSYKDYRNTIGRQTEVVDLDLSGDLRSDFRSGNPKKVSNEEFVVQLKRPKNVLKAEGLDDKYKRVFALTDKERKHFIETLNFEIAQLLK